MPFGSGQIDQASFSEQVDAAAVLHCVFVNEGASGALGGRQLFERRDVDFNVEVARVRDDGPILHDCEVLLGEYVLVAGDGAEDVADFGCLLHAHHAESVHDRFERFGRINFGDDYFRSRTARARSQTAAAPAIAGDHELRSREQEIRGADDAVDRRLPGPVTIVEQMFGVSVVDRHDRIAQHAFLGHGAQANHAGGRFFGAANHIFQLRRALGVQDGDQVGAVVHGELRLVIDRRHDVRVVGVAVLALDGENRNVVVANQTGGHVILRGKRV